MKTIIEQINWGEAEVWDSEDFTPLTSDDNNSDVEVDSSNITGSPKYFCKKCKDSSNNKKTGEECDEVIDSGGKCTDYDIELIINDLPSLKDKSGANKGKPSKNNFKVKDGKLYMRGESRLTDGLDVDFELKKENGTWMFYDEEKEGGAGWIPFEEYFTSSLHENKNIMIKENMDRLPQMIDDKLREFNFYTVDPKKGKQKISFTDDDREVMKNNFIDMSEKYPEDIAFIRSVVSCKDIDEKTNEPFVKLGSYRDSSNINLPFSKKVNGLEKVLDGGINYFTIENNPGPDNRDFKILPGDLIKDVEFSEESKEDMGKQIRRPSPQVEKQEPFEEVMKGKEKKGLDALVQTDEVSNNFTKKQKEILEKLKKQGYLFKQPVNQEGYEMKKVKSKEFTESFKVWKKKS